MTRSDFPRSTTDHMVGFLGLTCILLLIVIITALVEPVIASMGRPLWLIGPYVVVVLMLPGLLFVKYWWG